jgi:phosphoglycolate phosphatase
MAIEAVLFDIDGTLLLTGGAGAAAWQRAFRELWDVEANIAEHTRSGMTDPEIVEAVFEEVVGRRGDAREHELALGRYLVHLADTVAESPGYRILPGIEQTLARLSAAGVTLGVVTGNVEPAARLKLARGGLDRFFGFGGYGSDSRDRAELTRRAVQRAGEARGAPLRPEETIAVGDTPRDVRAGHGAGIRVVGVATGDYTVAQQREAGADWAIATVLDGLPV